MLVSRLRGCPACDHAVPLPERRRNMSFRNGTMTQTSKLGLQQRSIAIYAATTSQMYLSKQSDCAHGPPGQHSSAFETREGQPAMAARAPHGARLTLRVGSRPRSRDSLRRLECWNGSCRERYPTAPQERVPAGCDAVLATRPQPRTHCMRVRTTAEPGLGRALPQAAGPTMHRAQATVRLGDWSSCRDTSRRELWMPRSGGRTSLGDGGNEP